MLKVTPRTAPTTTPHTPLHSPAGRPVPSFVAVTHRVDPVQCLASPVLASFGAVQVGARRPFPPVRTRAVPRPLLFGTVAVASAVPRTSGRAGSPGRHNARAGAAHLAPMQRQALFAIQLHVKPLVTGAGARAAERATAVAGAMPGTHFIAHDVGARSTRRAPMRGITRRAFLATAGLGGKARVARTGARAGECASTVAGAVARAHFATAGDRRAFGAFGTKVDGLARGTGQSGVKAD